MSGEAHLPPQGSAPETEHVILEGLYAEAGFMVEHAATGLRLYAPNSRIETPAAIQALAITRTNRYTGAPYLDMLFRRPGGEPYAMEYSIDGGVGGGVFDAAVEYELQALSPAPIAEQLTTAGFQQAASQDPTKMIFRYIDRSDPAGKEAEILIVVSADDAGGDVVEGVFHPVNDPDDVIRPSRIAGLATAKDWKGEEIPSLLLSTDFLEYEIVFDSKVFPKNARQIRELTNDEAGIQRIPERTESTGFVIGGVNETALIRRLPTITDIPIADLTEKMRPGRFSDEGFLGEDEDLRKIMARDNDVVLPSGLTHQALAEPLKMAWALIKRGLVNRPCIISGHRYVITGVGSLGVQFSPYNDHLSGSSNYTVTNLETGQPVSTSVLGAHLIGHYQFYQGRGTSYRTPPEDIIKTFTHLQQHVTISELDEIVARADAT